jgi:hypothetical protein
MMWRDRIGSIPHCQPDVHLKTTSHDFRSIRPFAAMSSRVLAVLPEGQGWSVTTSDHVQVAAATSLKMITAPRCAEAQ